MTNQLTLAAAAIAVALSVAPALAQPVQGRFNEQFSFDVGGSVTAGEVREFVYDPATRRRLSYLNWRLDGVYGVTAGVTYKILPTIALRASGWMPVEKGEGTLKDFDYLLPNSTDWTHLSRSPTRLKDGYRADANVAIGLYANEGFSFYGIAGYRQQSFNFEARGGDYVYSSATGYRDQIGSFTPGELGISYLQTTRTPYLGMGATAEFGFARVTGEVVGSVFAKTDAKDTHHLRDLVFYDTTYNGKFIGGTIKAEYDITPQIAVTGTVSYDEYFDATGKTRTKDLITGDTATSPKGSSGAGSSILGVTVGVKAKL